MTGEEEPNPWVDFMQIRDMNQWWMWVNTTLIPNVRVQNWYNGDPPYGLRGYLDDRVNRIIGKMVSSIFNSANYKHSILGFAVIRQIRQDWGTCTAPSQLEKFVDECTGNLNVPYINEDTRYFKSLKEIWKMCN